MKFIGLLLTMFTVGYFCGINVVDNAKAESVEICPPFEEKIFMKEKIIALEPESACNSYDFSLTFEQNLRFCERLKLRVHNI
jgi:hypothetical protein|tara:strand:- start:1343 stop:1588 length:246 start_codon:yes stop_codon:yes gene_type:complete